MSFPSFNKAFVFRQPDGSPVEVRGWGDQFSARFETPDGYTVIRDDEGYYCYAELLPGRDSLRAGSVRVGSKDPSTLGIAKHIEPREPAQRTLASFSSAPGRAMRRCDVRRMRKKQSLRSMLAAGGPAAAPPKTAITGRYVGLCILIEFPDELSTLSVQQVEAFCNKSGYNEFGNNGSVRDYFLENSGGRLDYKLVVTGYYKAKHNKTYYEDESVTDGKRARELVTEALESLRDKNFDFSAVSGDDEGYVYAVNLFYAGYCSNNWSKGLWPHSWSLESPLNLAPGRKAFDYQMTDMGDQLKLATFCHENGHMICDFPDLYDYDRYSRGNGVGQYCLMCNSGPDETNPCQIDAYLKYKAGWSDKLTPITAGLKAKISAKKNDFFIHTKSATEYFLIENRQQNGRDKDLPGGGLAIWHIDELGNNNYEMMTEAQHYECSLEQADGKFDLERRINSGDSNDLFSAATSSRFLDRAHPEYKGPLATWWDGSPSGLSLTNISPCGDEMRFEATVFGEKDGESGEWTSSPKKKIPDNDPVGIYDIIDVPQSIRLSSISVKVDITHTFCGDLRLSLVSPSGAEIVLQDRQGGRKAELKRTYSSAENQALASLLGERTKGQWRLRVQDLMPADQGTLNSWSLLLDGKAQGVEELEESPGIIIPDNKTEGVTRSLKAQKPGKVGELSVSVDISHTWISDLRVALISPAGTSVLLHNLQGGDSDNIVKTYDTASTPELAKFVNEPISGNWTLKISDLAHEDLGKLNAWSVRITPGAP